jgi:predicted transcriptional regulator
MKNKTEIVLREMLELIRYKPGITVKELHECLGIKHSWILRFILIKRGLMMSVREGGVTRCYPTSPKASEDD